MKSAFGINSFAVYTVGLLCIFVIFDSTDAKIDTKCYGVFGSSCTTHRLSCDNNKVISITNAHYVYRPECNDIIGLSSCQNTDCCEWKITDCTISFRYEELQTVRSNCTGKQECSIRGMRRFNKGNGVNRVCSDSEISAYSRLEYTCIRPDTTTTKPTTTTTFTTALAFLLTTSQRLDINITTNTSPSLPSLPPTTTVAVKDTFSTSVHSNTINPTTAVTGITYPLTDSTNTAAIVGGVLGFLCIVLIIIIILLILYIKRKPPNSKPISDTQPTYAGLEFNSMEENTNDGQSNYDMIESSAAQTNPAFSSEEHVKTKTADPTYENIEQKKQKKRKKEVTKSTVNNNISEQSPNYLDVSQSPAPIYMNT